MKIHFTHLSRKSIRFTLTYGVALVLVPFCFLLLYSNLYAINVVRNQVAESNRNMVSLYLEQIDKNLNDIDKYFKNLIAMNSDVYNIMNNINQTDYFLSKISLLNQWEKDILMYKDIDSFFLYSSYWDEFNAINSKLRDYSENDQIKTNIINILQHTNNPDDLNLRGWRAIKINDKYYLLRIINKSNLYVGALIKAENLSIPMNLINLGDTGASLLATDNGEPMDKSQLVYDDHIDLKKDFQSYYLSGNSKKYLVVGKKSAVGNFNMVALIPDDKILQKLPKLQTVFKFLAIFTIIILPLCLLLLLRVAVLTPLNRILSAMKKIRDGEIEFRIPLHATSDEFHIVNETFNKMADQIKELKINVYEEQLSKQKAELEHLQLQINPHFFMNSLNIIHSFAQTKNYKLVQEMVLCLVRYFRYIFKSNLSFVPLKNELEHIQNYLRIQELRFPKRFTYYIDVPELLYDVPIPILMIQTFIENTIKYAVNMSTPIHISIKINTVQEESESYIKIIIQDTGKGFPDEVLAVLQEGRQYVDKQGEHIGIWNVQNRIKLLYSGKADIKLSNARPNGAIAEIKIPQLKEDLKGREDIAATIDC